jgi:negative regulator of flagellin synthesis FlgM
MGSVKIGNLPAVAMEQYNSSGIMKARRAEKAPMGTDRLELSDAARLFDEALLAVRETPGVRMDRVEAVRAQIATGTYTINAAVVAQKILGFGG